MRVVFTLLIVLFVGVQVNAQVDNQAGTQIEGALDKNDRADIGTTNKKPFPTYGQDLLDDYSQFRRFGLSLSGGTSSSLDEISAISLALKLEFEYRTRGETWSGLAELAHGETNLTAGNVRGFSASAVQVADDKLGDITHYMLLIGGKRYFGNPETASFFLTLGLGWSINSIDIPNKIDDTGFSLAFKYGMGVDFAVTRSISLGIDLSVISLTKTKVKNEEGTRLDIDGSEPVLTTMYVGWEF